MLAIGSCKSEKRTARLYTEQPLILDFVLLVSFLATIMYFCVIDHFPLPEFTCVARCKNIHHDNHIMCLLAILAGSFILTHPPREASAPAVLAWSA